MAGADNNKAQLNNKWNHIKEAVRSVLEAYKKKYSEDLTHAFETVITDRIVMWKDYLKSVKRKEFFLFFFISFILFLFACGFGLIRGYSYLGMYLLSIGLLGALICFIRILFIKGNTPLLTGGEKYGFKKAISDCWFETFTSVQIVYYPSILIYLILIIILYIYATAGFYHEIDTVLYKLYGKFNINAALPKSQIILYTVLLSNIAYVAGNFSYIFFRFFLYTRMTKPSSIKEKNDDKDLDNYIED